MNVTSIDRLRPEVAWSRVLTWARQPMDIPDRLPFEAMDRIYGDAGPSLQAIHHVRDTELVISSKRSGTIRPFVRVHPYDLHLYQALVDALAPTIEFALPPRDRAAAYRQTLNPEETDAFRGSIRNDEFKAGIQEMAAADQDAFVLQTDISGYFLGIQVDALIAQLNESTDAPDAVLDLGRLLGAWQELGVRGLPQGIRPSAPLSNFYMAPLDRTLGRLGIPFFRWIDDMWAICGSYGEARRVQDHIEEFLYPLGLTLNGEKTRILRAETAVAKLQPARERFERLQEEFLVEAEDLVGNGYDDDVYFEMPDDEEVAREVAQSTYEKLLRSVDGGQLPDDFFADISHALRVFIELSDETAIEGLLPILRRVPDLTDLALRYACEISKEHPEQAEIVFASILSPEHVARDHERMVACYRSLSLYAADPSSLSEFLGHLALTHDHSLIRAKAIVAWGKHSDPNDFTVIDQFLESADPQWKTYAFVAMQEKSTEARNARFHRWGDAAGTLPRLSEKLQEKPIKWTQL